MMDEPYLLTFLGRRPEQGTIETLRFRPDRPLAFKAGQWIHLAAALDIPDKSFVRHMSFASAPGDPELEFTMDLGSPSPYKTALRALKSGDAVKAFKLKGEFTVEDGGAGPLFFLAGGLGITPIRSLVRDLRSKGRADWSLLHVARDGFLFEKELSGCGGVQWRRDRAGFEGFGPGLFARQPKETRWYVSGSERFVDGMAQALDAAGFAPDSIKRENFTRH